LRSLSGGVRLDAGGPRPDRLNGGVEFGLTAAGHEDPRALGRETLGGGEADAGGAAGDDGDLSFEFARHDPSPCWRDKSVAEGDFSK
jgi:hypothetical protein